jgi:uncharacterized delta-60 repeat protein
MKQLSTLIIFLFAFNFQSLTAQQAGDNDPTFNTNDLGFSFGEGFNGAVNAQVVQPDGKIIAAGDFATYNSQARSRIIRLNVDGSIDDTFNPGTGFNSSVFAMKLLPDGKILAAGSFTSYNGTTRNRIIRLFPNGSIDPEFNPGTGFNNTVFTLAVQDDQKIIVGGQFLQFNSGPKAFIARLNANGSLDDTFDVGVGFNTGTIIRSLSLQTDGKVLVGGSFTTFNAISANRIIRLNTDGTRDDGFIIGTGANNTVDVIHIQNDGRIYIGGTFTTYNTIGRSRIARLNLNGSIDNDFNPGSGFNSTVFALTTQPDGKLLAGGAFTSFNGINVSRVVRINNTGAIDTEFNIGLGFNLPIYAISLLSNGKFYVGGAQTVFDGKTMNYLGKLNTDGTRDNSFNNATAFNGPVQSIFVLQDGKIMVGGTFTTYNNEINNNIVKLNPDGSIDNTFNQTGVGFNSNVFAFAELAGDILLVGGQFTTYNTATHNRIIALNPNGTLNTSLNLGAGANSVVRTIALQADGKILLGGAFTSFNGVNINRIVRLNTDGSIDNSFVVGTGFPSTVRSIAIQNDGKILVGGEFVSYNGVTAKNRIVRLNIDGSIDNTFNSGVGFNAAVVKLIVAPNQKIYASGEFTSFDNINRNRITRLNNNGSLDGQFNPGIGFNNTVNEIALQNDGKIIAVGLFTSYSGQDRNRIVRVNDDGNIDLTFNVGVGLNNTGNAVVLQSDGKAIVGGLFTANNNVGRNRITRLLNPTTDIVITSVQPNPICRGNDVTVNFNATLFNPIGNLSLELSNVSGSFDNPTILGSIAATNSGSFNVLVPNSVAFGTGYRMRIVSNTPALEGSDNGTDLSIIEGITANIVSPIEIGVNVSNTYQASVTGTAVSVNWNMGDGITYESQTSVQHTYTTIGDYTITLTVDNGSCVFTTTKTVNVGNVGINDLLTEANIKAFASGNNLFLEQGSFNLISAEVSLYNITGQLVHHWKNIELNNGEQMRLKTDLNTGVYILKLQAKEGYLAKRIFLTAE